jgi:hypothetical protein
VSTIYLPHVCITCDITATHTLWDVFFFFDSSPALLVADCELYAQPVMYKTAIETAVIL